MKKAEKLTKMYRAKYEHRKKELVEARDIIV